MNLNLNTAAHPIAYPKNRIDFKKIALLVIGICLFTGFTQVHAAAVNKKMKRHAPRAGSSRVADNSTLVTTISVVDLNATTGNPVSPVFSNTATNYTYTNSFFPPDDKVFVRITKRSNNPYATATVNGAAATDVPSAGYGGFVTLAEGTNDIVVVITAEDGVTTNTFHFAAVRPYSNADLSKLLYTSPNPDFYLKPGFSKNTLTYLALTKTTVDSIYLGPKTTDPYATITINGVAATNGAKSPSYNLVTGAPTATVVVTARNGTTTKTYVINARHQHLNNNLAGITLSGGTLSPAFSTAVSDYTVTVTGAPANIQITATAEDSTSKLINIENHDFSYGSLIINNPLSAGTHRYSFDVIPSDNDSQRMFKRTYTINVYRQISDSYLSNLQVSPGLLEPGFNPVNLYYTDTVTAASVQVTPTAKNPNALIKVNDVVIPSGQTSTVPLNMGHNIVGVRVNSEDNTTTHNYLTTIVRIPYKAALGGIVSSTGTISPAFNLTVSNYEISVPASTSTISLKPIVNKNYPGVTAKVNGTAVTLGTFSSPISLSTGNNLVSVVVTAADSSETFEYVVNVKRLSSNANVGTIALSEGHLSPTLSVDTFFYTATVSNSTDSLTIAATSEDPNAKVNIYQPHNPPDNPDLVGGKTIRVPLQIGTPNNYTVYVESQDGSNYNQYRLIITRPSNNANLGNLTVSAGRLTPAFTAGNVNYTDTVTEASVTIRPRAANLYATIRVNDVPVADNTASDSLALAMGNNLIQVLVTSQDSSKSRTYFVNVVRVPKDALLADLQFSSGALSPAFLPTTGTYKTTVSNATSSITVTPVADVAYPGVTVNINGTPVTPGTASPALPLAVGNNFVTTVVTSAGGTYTKTYKTLVARLAATTNNADLQTLSINDGSILSLSPAFDPGTFNYTATGHFGTSGSFVTAKTSDDNATMTINGTPVNNLSSPTAIPMPTPVTTITVVVTSQDSSQVRTYTVVVTKPGSNNANLSSISILTSTSSLSLSPAFAAGTTSYTASTSYASSSVTVKPVAANGHASMKVNGVSVPFGGTSASLPLAVGNNTITVTATSEDLSKTRTYTVTVNRAPETFAFTPQGKTDIGPKNRLNVTSNVSEPLVRQAVSPNGDGINDVLLIDGVENFADNSLKIMNRDGNLVFEKAKYNNISSSFDGHSGINGRQLPAGTYFYSLEYAAEDGKAKHKTGFFVLKY